MKKNFFLTICLAVLSISQAMAQAAKVALQHDGFVTLYNTDELQKALDASVDGDTIYLNEGTFTGNVTIAKKVSLIGAGQNTIISGSITITYNGTLIARILDGLNINNSLILSGKTNGLCVRKCSFHSLVFGSFTENALFDRCFQNYTGSTGRFNLNNNIKNLRVVNSKIADLYGKVDNVANAVFVNCNVHADSYVNDAKATFINCIIRNWNSSFYEDSYFTNCYMYTSINSVNEKNCEYGTFNWGTDFEFNGNIEITGTDGTQVGIYGGTTPYTLVPSVPTVTSYNLNVNTTTKRLNVNISVESK